MTKVVLFEDASADAQRFLELLWQYPDRFVVQHYSDYSDLEARITAFQPTVALLDIRIGNVHDAGIQAIQPLKKKYPELKIIMMTDMINFIHKAFEEGADGYIMKDDIGQSLDFIEDVSRGKVSSSKVIDRLVYGNKSSAVVTLTATEVRIIGYSATDLTVKQITDKLKLTKSALTTFAVEAYIRGLKIKLGCNTIQGVVGKCLYYDLVDVSGYFEELKDK
jgi:DNA-binding NarL/FixJ family response regulator